MNPQVLIHKDTLACFGRRYVLDKRLNNQITIHKVYCTYKNKNYNKILILTFPQLSR